MTRLYQAMAPDVPQYKDAYQPMVKDNCGLVNLDFKGTSSLFIIVITAFIVALILAICRQGMRCLPMAWMKRRDQQELSNHLQQTMEIAEDFNNKLGNRALEFRAEEGRGT